jgi:glycosyltransferase involved in cell wall biosynthesis
MKIFILATDLSITGGIQSYTKNLAQTLQKILPENHFQVWDISSKEKGFKKLSRIPWVIKLIIAFLKERPDTLWLTHIGLAPVAAALLRLRKVKVIITTHGIEVWKDPLPQSQKKILKKARKVVAVSKFTAQTLKQKNLIGKNQAFVLYPTIDFNLFRPCPINQNLVKKLDLQGKKIILTVARLDPRDRYKGLDKTILSLKIVQKKIPQIIYLIAGSGEDQKYLQTLAQKQGVLPMVKFIHPGRLELADFYNLADVFIMPSRTRLWSKHPQGEGFGIVFLEAQTAGLPVIGPNYGAPLEAFIPGKTGLTADPDSPQDIAKVIINLLQNESKAKQMGRAGQKFVTQNFSQKVFAQKIQKLLNSSL